MDSMWEYNAPQYVDFTKRMDDDRADAYFGMFASRTVLAADRRSRGKRPGNARNRSAIYRNSKTIC